jgi:Icc-related predicted phosphoesterase
MVNTITVIGDTHGCHQELKLESADMLIHTGDVTAYGTEPELYDFLVWLIQQPFKHKVFVAGNHDICLDTPIPPFISELPPNVYYLNNQSITIEGLNLYGSPVSPFQAGMAFNRHRGEEISKEWQLVPSNTDILITHTPPAGILDNGTGCEELRKTVERITPQLHLFGHVHEGYGRIKRYSTLFVNAALTNTPNYIDIIDYELVNAPLYSEINKDA